MFFAGPCVFFYFIPLHVAEFAAAIQ